MRASLIGALALVLVLGITGITWAWRQTERARRIALRQAYAGDIHLVQRYLEDGVLGQARSLLDRYRPASKSQIDLRGWEWRYLWGLCRSDDHLLLTPVFAGREHLVGCELAWLRVWLGRAVVRAILGRNCRMGEGANDALRAAVLQHVCNTLSNSS